MKHTKELWKINTSGSARSGEGFRVDEFYVYAPDTVDDVAICSDVIDPVTQKPSEANARRIVACVNALQNVSTEWLEQNKAIVVLGAPISDRFRELEKQRDELLTICEELQEAAEYWSEYFVPLGIVERLDAAIAKVKGCA